MEDIDRRTWRRLGYVLLVFVSLSAVMASAAAIRELTRHHWFLGCLFTGMAGALIYQAGRIPITLWKDSLKHKG